jgi:hypothetical protein
MQRLDDRLVLACLAHRSLVDPLQRDAVLVDAIGGLGAVDAFVGFFVSELDDLDALHVAAHRVQMVDRVEIASMAVASECGHRYVSGFGAGSAFCASAGAAAPTAANAVNAKSRRRKSGHGARGDERI